MLLELISNWKQSLGMYPKGHSSGMTLLRTSISEAYNTAEAKAVWNRGEKGKKWSCVLKGQFKVKIPG